MTPTEKIQSIQTILSVVPDGKFGAKSHAALDQLIVDSGDVEKAPEIIHLPPSVTAVDARSETNIRTLNIKVQGLARSLVQRAAEHGIVIIVTSATRSYDQQNALYEQGRSSPGNIVTNARGGYSNHNFGIAFDVTVFKEGKPVWESPAYNVVGMLGKQLGLSWGGDWHSIQDDPHFELHPSWAKDESESSMLAELRKRHESGQDAFA